MTTPTQAAEARRAEIARLAQAWVDREVAYENAVHTDTAIERNRLFRLCEQAEAAFLSELSRLQAALAAREGYVLVPMEPTLEMVIAGCQSLKSRRQEIMDATLACNGQNGDHLARTKMRFRYAAMLAARPTPADSGEGK